MGGRLMHQESRLPGQPEPPRGHRTLCALGRGPDRVICRVLWETARDAVVVG
jgi:hypothetical protein